MAADAADTHQRLKWSAVAAAVALVTLVLASPLAMSFRPYAEIGRQGVWSGTYRANRSYPLRAGLIAFGLVATIAAGVVAVGTCRREGWSRGSVAAISTFGACWALGWHSYPYWINGVFRASDLAIGGALDPKALPPMTWIGELWRIPVIVGYPVGFLWAAVSLLAGVRSIFARRGASLWGWGVVVTSGITVAALLYCPEYGTWLMD
jgi:hypothetical protein